MSASEDGRYQRQEFRNSKDGPEVAAHKSRRDAKRCKRNKGQPHDMQLVKDEVKTWSDFRSYNIPGWRVHEQRPFQWHDKEWRCTFCHKKDITHPWSAEREYVGDWTEVRRVRRATPK